MKDETFYIYLFSFLIIAMVIWVVVYLRLPPSVGFPKFPNPPKPPPHGNFHTKNPPLLTKDMVAPPPKAVVTYYKKLEMAQKIFEAIGDGYGFNGSKVDGIALIIKIMDDAGFIYGMTDKPVAKYADVSRGGYQPTVDETSDIPPTESGTGISTKQRYVAPIQNMSWKELMELYDEITLIKKAHEDDAEYKKMFHEKYLKGVNLASKREEHHPET